MHHALSANQAAASIIAAIVAAITAFIKEVLRLYPSAGFTRKGTANIVGVSTSVPVAADSAGAGAKDGDGGTAPAAITVGEL